MIRPIIPTAKHAKQCMQFYDNNKISPLTLSVDTLLISIFAWASLQESSELVLDLTDLQQPEDTMNDTYTLVRDHLEIKGYTVKREGIIVIIIY